MTSWSRRVTVKQNINPRKIKQKIKETYLYRLGGCSSVPSSIITLSAPPDESFVILIFSILLRSRLHCAILPKRSDNVKRVVAVNEGNELSLLLESSEPDDEDLL